MKNTKTDGRKAEELTARYLEHIGMVILEKNYRCRQGEVDLIGKDREYLVFIEVKARKTNACGYPGEAVTVRKQQRICKAAGYYCCKEKSAMNRPVRFDVVEILDHKIRHIKNAFDYR